MDHSSEMDKFVAETRKSIKDFEEKEYPYYSFQQKVTYWLSVIHSGMRYYGESIGNPYDQFSRTTYKKWVEFEPEIDAILNAVFPRLESFDVDEFKKRIEQ